MFAVIQTGGKQYKISPGDRLLVEKLEGSTGQVVQLNHILMIGDDQSSSVGTPTVAKSEVKAVILEQTRGDKIIIFKKKRRQNYRRKAGHRQDLTHLWIEEIVVNGTAHKAEKRHRLLEKNDEVVSGDTVAPKAKEVNAKKQDHTSE